MNSKLLIFDCDGVLVDSELISLGLLIDHCAEHGLTLDIAQACECFLGKPVSQASAEANRIHGTSIPDVDLALFQQRILRKFGEDLQPVPGTLEALEELGAPKCVASSSNPERIAVSIDRTGLARFFQGQLYSTDMVARGKPYPDIFLHAAKAMGFTPSQAIVIEDSPAGLQAAKAAGMATIAFAGGKHAALAGLENRLLSLQPNILIRDMAHLPAAAQTLMR